MKLSDVWLFYSEIVRCAAFFTLDIEQLKEIIESNDLYTVEEENVCIKVV